MQLSLLLLLRTTTKICESRPACALDADAAARREGKAWLGLAFGAVRSAHTRCGRACVWRHGVGVCADDDVVDR